MVEKQEDMLIAINDVHYTVNYSQRKEPCQVVGVWCRNPPFPTKMFEINCKASKEQITECIKVYIEGYEAGYGRGMKHIQYEMKKLLDVRD